MSRYRRSFEHVTARASNSTAAELQSPARAEATSARVALVCIVTGKNVLFVKDRLVFAYFYWLGCC